MLQFKKKYPVARKEHICMFCGGVIDKGEKYERETNSFENKLYDWVCHLKCSSIACQLDMYNDVDEYYGLDSDGFKENIREYISANHYDEIRDDVEDGWDFSYKKAVEKIYEKLISDEV